jgi:hypothetical protein
MFDTNRQDKGSRTMTRYDFNEFPGTSSVVGTVTLLVSGWLFLAAATMVATPTDTTVARASAVTVKPLGVMPAPQPPLAIAPEARLTILVEARRTGRA